MQTFNVKTYSSQTSNDRPHEFFILSKGSNAGRPMEKPCPNCFVVTTSDEGDRLSLYWLCYALWQGGCFREFLVGSVIEFIRIDDVRKLLKTHTCRITLNPDTHLKYLNLLQNLLTYEDKLKDQLQKLKTLRASLAKSTLNVINQTSPVSQS